jgi:hypothetical protein
MKLYLHLLAALTVFASSVFAAETKNPVAPKAAVTAPDTKAAWERRIPVLESDGLPLVEVVKHLRDQFPELNFLIRPSDRDRDLGGTTVRFQLRNVTFPEIVKAIELAADVPIQITATPEDRLVVFDFKQRPADTFAQVPIITRAYSLSVYLSGLGDEEAAQAMKELYNAIEVAGQLTTEATRGERRFDAKLQMHRGTKLLIAVGRADDLQIVDQIAEQLRISGPRALRAVNDAKAGDAPSAKGQSVR